MTKDIIESDIYQWIKFYSLNDQQFQTYLRKSDVLRHSGLNWLSFSNFHFRFRKIWLPQRFQWFSKILKKSSKSKIEIISYDDICISGCDNFRPEPVVKILSYVLWGNFAFASIVTLTGVINIYLIWCKETWK